MDENELRRKMQAGELAANNGTVMRTLAIAGCDFKFLKLKGLLLALAGGMDRMALCSSINYLADSGYLQVRCIEDKAPSSVSDAELEDLEVKLTPCALPGFVDSKNEEKTERNAGYLVVSHSGGGMLRQGTRKGIRRTPANRGMRAHRVVKGLDISEDVCHGMCP